jgi:hypothetical protein
MAKKVVIFTIPEKLLMEPVLYQITSENRLESAVYMSEVNAGQGIFTLELKGEEKQIEEALACATAKGIAVKVIK